MLFRSPAATTGSGRLAGRRTAGGLEADGQHRALRKFFLGCQAKRPICAVAPAGMTPIETGGFLPSIIHSSKSLPEARSPGNMRQADIVAGGIVDDEIFDVAAVGGQRGDEPRLRLLRAAD